MRKKIDHTGLEKDDSQALFAKLDGKRKNPVKCSTMLAVSLGLYLLGLSPCSGMQILSDSQESQTCLSEDCANTGKRILSAMDFNVDPCDDFYEFACGNWTNNNPNPGWKSQWSPFMKFFSNMNNDIQKLLEDNTLAPEGTPTSVVKAKKLYKSCMDTDKVENIGISPLHRTLTSLGLPSQVPRVWSGTPWYKLAAGIRNTLGLDTLLEVKVDDIFRILRVSPVSPIIDEKYLMDPEFYAAELVTYRKFIRDMVRVLDPEADEKIFAEDIIRFNTSLAQSFHESYCGDDYSGVTLNVSNNNATDAKLPESSSQIHNNVFEAKCSEGKYKQLNFSNINETDSKPESSEKIDLTTISRYLALLFENTVEMRSEDTIVVTDWYYLRILMELLNNTDPLIVEKYLFWHVFVSVGPKTQLEFRELDLEFYRVLGGHQMRKPRWAECTEIVNKNFEYALSYFYVQTKLKEASKNSAHVLEDIREAFKSEVETLNWIDEDTRSKILSKLGAIRNIVGWQDQIITPETLDDLYNTSEVVEGNFFENYFNLKQAEAKHNLQSIRKISNETSTFIMLSLSNQKSPFYAHLFNIFGIPAVFLQPPFYDTGFEAVNYGSFGYVAAHEVVHGYDNKGHLLDEDGMASNWSASTLEHYEQKVQCIIDQYNQYNTSQFPNITVDGVKTQSDNIADNGGVRVAFNAFKLYMQRDAGSRRARLPNLTHYEPEQLFFLSVAQNWCGSFTPKEQKMLLAKDVHSPNKIRVIGTLTNSQEFADAWKCPAGSPMNPVDKCVLW